MMVIQVMESRLLFHLAYDKIGSDIDRQQILGTVAAIIRAKESLW